MWDSTLRNMDSADCSQRRRSGPKTVSKLQLLEEHCRVKHDVLDAGKRLDFRRLDSLLHGLELRGCSSFLEILSSRESDYVSTDLLLRLACLGVLSNKGGVGLPGEALRFPPPPNSQGAECPRPSGFRDSPIFSNACGCGISTVSMHS